MKKRLIAFCVAACGMLTVSQGEVLNINGDFARSQLNFRSVRGWTKNYPLKPNIGKSAAIKGEKPGTFALKVTTTSEDTPFFSVKVPAKVGDKFKVNAKVTGSGKIQFRLYLYKLPDYLGSAIGKEISSPADGMISDEITIKPVKRGDIESIAVAFLVLKNSDVVIHNIAAEKITAPSGK